MFVLDLYVNETRNAERGGILAEKTQEHEHQEGDKKQYPARPRRFWMVQFPQKVLPVINLRGNVTGI
jgi:hypothetical protein